MKAQSIVELENVSESTDPQSKFTNVRTKRIDKRVEERIERAKAQGAIKHLRRREIEDKQELTEDEQNTEGLHEHVGSILLSGREEDQSKKKKGKLKFKKARKPKEGSAPKETKGKNKKSKKQETKTETKSARDSTPDSTPDLTE